MSYEYDYAIAGAAGQIGNALVQHLATRGRIHFIRRGDDLALAPSAKHVINAAGYTKFDKNVEAYWRDNVRFAVEIATYARIRGSHFHQLSSEAVAEYRTDVLPETVHSPIADPRMIDYALSKVLVERAVTSISDPSLLSIYRCSDVVPPANQLVTHWRANHWLAILFSAGKEGFDPGDEFPVWIALTSDLAGHIADLVDLTAPGAYHLLGHRYTFRQFQGWAEQIEVPAPLSRHLVNQVKPVIRINPPLFFSISQGEDWAWTRLGSTYWRQFASKSVWSPRKEADEAV